jgi:hypothetical protein
VRKILKMKQKIITLVNGDKVSSFDIQTKRILTLFKILLYIITVFYVCTSKNWYIDFPLYLINFYIVGRFLKLFRKNRNNISEEDILHSNFFFVFDAGFKIQTTLDYVSILYGKKIPLECKIFQTESGCPAHLGMIRNENATEDVFYIGLEYSLLCNHFVEENGYIIIHEYTHFTHKDYQKLNTLFSWMLYFCPLNPIVFLPMSLIFCAYIQRRAEYAADHVAATVIGKEHAISMLTKIKRAEDKQLAALSKKQITRLSLYLKLIGTHPPIQKRIQFIESL